MISHTLGLRGAVLIFRVRQNGVKAIVLVIVRVNKIKRIMSFTFQNHILR